MTIYISTGSIKNKSIQQSIDYLSENGIKNIELSGGQHDPDIFQKLKSYKNKINFMLHNYFPPPKVPFTLNLATLNDEIFEQSRNHIVNSIRISSKLEIPYYSFHAGFLIDPNPKELGKKITSQKKNDENIATKVFLERVNEFANLGKKEGVKILIENNVINKQNLKTFNGNPFMMTSIKQTENLVKYLPNNVYILLDLAHLKISSRTLDFSASEFLKKFDNKIKAYHISDNSGDLDTNDVVTKNSWFWQYLKKDKAYYTFELKTENTNIIKDQIKMLRKFIN